MTPSHPQQKPEGDDLIRRRVERITGEQRKLQSHLVSFFGLQLFAAPEVFCPVYGEGSRLLAEALTEIVTPEDRVLDVGTGSGALALLAAAMGAVATGTDISPAAIKCARANACRNGLVSRTHFLISDLFVTLPVDRRYSIIAFNPPFLDGAPSSWFERALFDPGHRTLLAFLHAAQRYLAPGGRILLAFSNASDNKCLEAAISRMGYRWRIRNTLIGEFLFLLYELEQGVEHDRGPE